MSTTTRSYTGWLTEPTDAEIRDGQAASYERFIGRQMAQAAIAEYDSTWSGHHGKEISTRQSQRRFANALAEAQTR
jgi:hypothetical protein